MREIEEPDWKLLRRMHELALERYCRRVLDESEQLHADTSQSAHQRYLAIYQLFHQRDKELGQLFNDLRRSNALWQLAAIKGRGLLTDAEFAQFSEQTQNLVAALLGEVSG